MSDDEADPELLELLRQRLGISSAPQDGIPRDTGVLKDAEYIYNNSIDVHVDMYGTKGAALEIYQAMRARNYSTETWSAHELHPKISERFSEQDIVNFVFTMDLLNFSFWSELESEERFQIEYRDKRWTGYNSLVACLRRALDDGIPFTTPRFWTSPACTESMYAHVFRSATAEPIPLFSERIAVLQEASTTLREVYGDGHEDQNIEEYFEDMNVVGAHSTGHSAANDVTVQTSSAPTQAAHDADLQPHDEDTVTSTTNLDPVDSTPGPLPAAEVEAFPNPVSIFSNGLTDSPELPNQEEEPNDASRSVNGIYSEQPAADTATTDPSAGNMQSIQSSISQSDRRSDHSVVRLVQESDRSAGKLVNLLVKHFDCFRDETRFDGRRVRLLKRAQIFVADLWAALNGTGPGYFHDIDHLTMFADYRVPQSLHSLGVLTYSPPLDHHVRSLQNLESGHSWEVQLRGCSIWAVEMIRREILRNHPEATSVNAVLIDFFLYDLAKEKEAQGKAESQEDSAHAGTGLEVP